MSWSAITLPAVTSNSHNANAMSSDEENKPTRRRRAIGRAQVPPGPLADLKALLYELYLKAGTPPLDEITKAVADDDQLLGAPGGDTVARVLGSAEMPGTQADVVAVATVLALGGPVGSGGRGSTGSGPVGCGPVGGGRSGAGGE